MVRLLPSAYSIPKALQEYIDYANEHKQERLVMKPMPMVPVRIQGGMYDLVYTSGPLLTRHVVPGSGNLLGVA